MCQQLIEAGCCEAEAAQATSSEAQDELCELVKHLLLVGLLADAFWEKQKHYCFLLGIEAVFGGLEI